MPNMSYCRFSNTLGDLRDCVEHLDDSVEEDCELCVEDEQCVRDHVSEAEASARRSLVALCKQIATDYAVEDES